MRNIKKPEKTFRVFSNDDEMFKIVDIETGHTHEFSLKPLEGGLRMDFSRTVKNFVPKDFCELVKDSAVNSLLLHSGHRLGKVYVKDYKVVFDSFDTFENSTKTFVFDEYVNKIIYAGIIEVDLVDRLVVLTDKALLVLDKLNSNFEATTLKFDIEELGNEDISVGQMFINERKEYVFFVVSNKKLKIYNFNKNSGVEVREEDHFYKHLDKFFFEEIKVKGVGYGITGGFNDEGNLMTYTYSLEDLKQ